MKWEVELSEYDILFKTRTTIKGQVLVDFVVEFANVSDVKEVIE